MENNYYSGGLDTNCRSFLKEVFNSNLATELSSDYIIPENIYDIESILLCNATTKVNEQIITGGMFEVIGEVSYDVLLMCEDGTINSVNYTEPFNIKEVCEDLVTESTINVLPGKNIVVGKLVNPRKLNVKSTVNVGVEVYSPVSTQVNIKGAESIDDDMNIQRKHSSTQCISFGKADKNDINVSYDIELDGSYPPVSELLYIHLYPSTYENKASNDAINVKTNVHASLLYKSEEGNIFSFEKSMILDEQIQYNDANTYDWNSNAYCSVINAQIAPNSYGERKLIELDFVYSLNVLGTKNTNLSFVTDMYSTEYKCNTVQDDESTKILKRTYLTSLSVNSSCTRESLGSENIRGVILDTVEIRDTTLNYNDSKNKLVVIGNSIIRLVCETNAIDDTESRFITFEYEYPFKCEIDAASENIDSSTLSIYVTESRHRADSTNLYCDFELAIKVNSYENESIKLLKEVLLIKNEPHERYGNTLTLCYPAGNESLWDIAKYYHTTKESIIVSNDLDSEDISMKKVLLIPAFKAKKAVISKVV